MTQTQSRKKNLFQMNVDLMHGPIFRSLVLFMLPILISNLFQQLYNTVDTMIVGNVLGDTALAAIGSCGAIYELLVGFGLGIGNGLAIVAARAYGAQDEDLLKTFEKIQSDEEKAQRAAQEAPGEKGTEGAER